MSISLLRVLILEVCAASPQLEIVQVNTASKPVEPYISQFLMKPSRLPKQRQLLGERLRHRGGLLARGRLFGVAAPAGALGTRAVSCIV